MYSLQESEDSGKKSSDDSEQEEMEERGEPLEKETNKESEEEKNNKYREKDSEDVVAEPGFEDENTSDEEVCDLWSRHLFVQIKLVYKSTCGVN